MLEWRYFKLNADVSMRTCSQSSFLYPDGVLITVKKLSLEHWTLLTFNATKQKGRDHQPLKMEAEEAAVVASQTSLVSKQVGR